jgi:hypothetical protein
MCRLGASRVKDELDEGGADEGAADEEGWDSVAPWVDGSGSVLLGTDNVERCDCGCDDWAATSCFGGITVGGVVLEVWFA